ncbi:Low temperature requirement protein LtrA [Micromonospora phaseoli]|uniref:Low temperature requirement protein LtrA n=1 Tax=Micromonospora phaseoli TaxID=1144548 RepID=A0A1H6V825_9ACTN|nr:low temperature requirement protein A [Micromonospora phaseoli]PZV93824.1 low temperature requirement protein LtrA [Micromonospora phaseoli]GIJ80732.1 low temperature requirement protein A [Micromonospora phaseoli]SEI96482.1 Low temperature requirement protein LtrA [Micromonospora phaseoli]
MWPIFRSRVVVTTETHRTTMHEIFFDLVFVFALIRVTEYMSERASPLTLLRGLLVLLLLWISWLIYSWLGNQARADVGLIQAGTTVAMAAVFLAALVIPDVWDPSPGPRLVLVLSYMVVRVIHLTLYHRAAGQDRRLRRTIRIYTTTTGLSWIPLVLGAVFGGTAQFVLWSVALVVDLCGGLIASRISGWPLRSPGHFTERYGLVVIIALGETLISVGSGVGAEVVRFPILLAASFTLVIIVCLFRLYMVSSAAAGAALIAAAGPRQDRLAADAYSLGHFPLVAGTIFLAFGVHEVLASLAHDDRGTIAGAHLEWASAAGLFGGVALYLAGKAVFLGLSVRSVSLADLLAPAVALALLPAGRLLPGLVALGLLTAGLVVLVGYQRAVDSGGPGETARQASGAP